MPYLGNPPAERFTSLSKQTITGDGGTAYTLDFPVGSNQDVEVFVNNVRQEPSVAYTVSGTSLTMTGAVQSSDDFYVVFQGKAIGTISHPAANALEATSGTFTGNVDINGNELILDADGDTKIVASTDDTMAFETAGSEAMRIDSSGNVLVGKTVANTTTLGNTVYAGIVSATMSGDPAIFANRAQDGSIIELQKDGSTVGSIVTQGGNIILASGSVGVGVGDDNLYPTNGSGASTDSIMDVGDASARFDDIYAANGTIATSDRNEKQDIEALTDAEQRVAVAAKGLMRKFRWKDRVAEKGDDARIHFGIIAQDLQAAFEAEGLDAGRYAMFIHSDWWETTETYTDDDGVEQTRTNTYDSEDEAPDGAVKKSRMGVRYSELLAFIIAAI